MLDSLQFSSFAEFLDMGGYAFNVWSVYLLFVIFFAFNLYHPLLRKRQIMREQRRRLLLNKESENRNQSAHVITAGSSTAAGEQP